MIPMDDDEDPLVIPLSMTGATTCFPTRKPTRQEWEASSLAEQLELTAEEPEWDPSTDRFAKQEAAMLDANGMLRDEPTVSLPDRFVAALHALPQESQPEHDFGTALQGTVRVCTTIRQQMQQKVMKLTVVRSSKRTHPLSARQLAKKWGIGVGRAEKTLEAMTQQGVRATLHPALSRRFRTNDRQLRCRRLAHDMFADTLKSRVLSWQRQNRHAQVFAT